MNKISIEGVSVYENISTRHYDDVTPGSHRHNNRKSSLGSLHKAYYNLNNYFQDYFDLLFRDEQSTVLVSFHLEEYNRV